MNREDNMAGYAQQGSPGVLAPIDKIKMVVTVTGVDAAGMAIFTLEGEDPADKPYVDNPTKTIRVPSGPNNVLLRYKLRDDTNPKLGLDFCTGSPIWVTDQNSCPKSACSNSEIVLKSVSKSQLEVTDLNGSLGDYRFSLVLDGDSGRVLADPIIKNEP